MSEKKELERPALYVVATPIGNLEDITLRAIRTLKECDLVLSEDTRKTGILLSHLDIHTQKKSYRVHHLKEDTQWAVHALGEGKAIALTTDAGTPCLSDPGSFLVRSAREAGFPVIPIPGVSALAAALSVSGFQAQPSVFTGFLSPKSGKRRKALERLKNFEGATVLYESVHRMEKLLVEIADILPDREVFVAREITKYYEELRLLPAGYEAGKEWEKMGKKGEFTVVIGPEA